MASIIGKKVGMTSIFDADGNNIPCTVVEAGPCVVTQVKTVENDGYSAVQLAFGDKKEKNTPQAMLGHFKKANTTPKRTVMEFRDIDMEFNTGDVVKCDIFQDGDFCEVVGTSKGKGFQGVVKRHNFSGVGAQTHGQHDRQRAPGSLGASSWPSRVMKGMRMAGHKGVDRVKVQNLQVVKVSGRAKPPTYQRSNSRSQRILRNGIEIIMELSVYNLSGKETGRKARLNDQIFGIDPNDHAIYLDVKQFLANKRQGTHKAKERNEVSGTTKKLKRQKGTGGARAGSMKSPVFVGGGRIFGPRPRDYSFSLNKKLKRLARISALSHKAKANTITVLEDFSFDQPRTKLMVDLVRSLQLSEKKTLVIVPQTNKNVYLSSRNLERSKVVTASDLNTYDIVNAQNIVVTEGSLPVIESTLLK